MNVSPSTSSGVTYPPPRDLLRLRSSDYDLQLPAAIARCRPRPTGGRDRSRHSDRVAPRRRRTMSPSVPRWGRRPSPASSNAGRLFEGVNFPTRAGKHSMYGADPSHTTAEDAFDEG